MKTQAIALKVNVQGLLESLKSSFSGSDTFVTELLQNARRSGATQIHCAFDEVEGTFAILDDGCGISDFQNLISVAESGWSDEVTMQERAFGIGWLSCLFSADRVRIESKGSLVEFETSSIRSFEAAFPEKADHYLHGTRITLYGLSFDRSGMSVHDFRKMLAGFPVDVFYQGEYIHPHEAITEPANWAQVEGVGHIDIKARGIDSVGQTGFIAYYQGFPILSTNRSLFYPHAVVHLDSQAFVARAPDRTQLVDEDQAMEVISKAIKGVWRKRLIELKEELGDKEFVLKSYDACIVWGCLDLWNDIDFFPGELIQEYLGYPSNGFDQPVFLSNGKGLISKEDLSKLTLARDPDPSYMESYAPAMYAWLHGMKFVKNLNSFQGHWIQSLVKEFTDKDLEVSFSNAREDTFSGHDDVPVVLCDSYTIDGPLGPISSSEDPFVMLDENSSEFENQVMVIPTDGSETAVLDQIWTFCDEHGSPQYTYRDQMIEQFDLYLANLSLGNEAELVRRVIDKSSLPELSSLNGKAFTVAFNADGSFSVELIA